MLITPKTIRDRDFEDILNPLRIIDPGHNVSENFLFSVFWLASSILPEKKIVNFLKSHYR